MLCLKQFKVSWQLISKYKPVEMWHAICQHYIYLVTCLSKILMNVDRNVLVFMACVAKLYQSWIQPNENRSLANINLIHISNIALHIIIRRLFHIANNFFGSKIGCDIFSQTYLEGFRWNESNTEGFVARELGNELVHVRILGNKNAVFFLKTIVYM